MKLVDINARRDMIAQMIEAQAERDAAAIRKASFYRIKPKVRRCDSKNRTRPRAA
jgi:hypothetical protein